MGANISNHKRHQEKVTNKNREATDQKPKACGVPINDSTVEAINDIPEEEAETATDDKEDNTDKDKKTNYANNNPKSLVITICMLKMENSEKKVVDQPAVKTPKCRCDASSSVTSALNDLNISRNSRLNIVCDNYNGNSVKNNDSELEENVNLLNNNSESNQLSINRFNKLDNNFENFTLDDINQNRRDEIYNHCPMLQLSGGSIISMDMDGLQGQFKMPDHTSFGLEDEKILNTSLPGPSHESYDLPSTDTSFSSCCSKNSSTFSKGSTRKCKCGTPSSSKESSTSSSKSSNKKSGNWSGLKFNRTKVKSSSSKANVSFPTSGNLPMESSRQKPESCICKSYRKVDDFHHINTSPIAHHELLLDSQGHIIHRIERTVRNTPNGDFLVFVNHAPPMLNIISRSNDENSVDEEDRNRTDTNTLTNAVPHPQSLFFCTHNSCQSSNEPMSLLHKRFMDSDLNNPIDIPHMPHRIHSQVDFVHFLVPDLQKILACSYYWAKIDRYEAEKLLDGKPEGTFLLRDSAQEEFLFSVSFRKYNRSLHARIEQFNHKFSFDSRDPGVYTASTVTGLLEHYKDPSFVMFFEPMLTQPLNRNFCFSLQQLCRATIVSHTTYDGVDQLCLPNSLKNYLKEYHYKQRVRVRPIESLYSNIP